MSLVATLVNATNLTTMAANATATTAPEATVLIADGQIDMTWVISAPAIEVCAVAMVVSLVLSTIDMYHHVSFWEHPKLQSGTVRILFMVPIYAVLSWLILLKPSSQFVLRTIRDTYEAFVLYQFLALLIEYCGGESQLIQSLERKKHKGIHPWPMCWLPLFNLDRTFYVRCKRWVLQYAILKPLMALIALIAHPLGWYDETNFNWGTNLYPWLFLVYNVSISYSLWYLVVFDLETHRELAYCKPLLKFVCIKAIIFFSYWQSAALSIMLSEGLLYTGSTEAQQDEVSGCIQEFLICIELVPIAILHHFGFGVTKLEEEMEEQPLYESAENVRRSESKLKRLDEALSLGQFFKDTASAVFTKANQLTHGVVNQRKGPQDANGQTVDDEELTFWGVQPTAQTKQQHALFSRGAWPAEQSVQIGPGGSTAATAVALCTAVAVARGMVVPTTGQVFNTAMQLEQGRRAAAQTVAPVDGEDVDTDDALSDSTTEEDDEDDEKQQDRASRDAFSFGIRVDNLRFVVKTATSINRAVSRVLFDDNSGPSVGDFCVVCGRNDRVMVQRRSGMKCKECLGTKHNYNVERGSGTASSSAARASAATATTTYEETTTAVEVEERPL